MFNTGIDRIATTAFNRALPHLAASYRDLDSHARYAIENNQCPRSGLSTVFFVDGPVYANGTLANGQTGDLAELLQDHTGPKVVKFALLPDNNNANGYASDNILSRYLDTEFNRLIDFYGNQGVHVPKPLARTTITIGGKKSPAIVMEDVGRHSASVLKARKDRPANTRAIAHLVYQVANTLEYAHQQGIVHRDIKPSNLLTTKGKRWNVIDWATSDSIERIVSGDTDHIFTPPFSDPDQYLKEGPNRPILTQGYDPKMADQYALGVTVLKLLFGDEFNPDKHLNSPFTFPFPTNVDDESVARKLTAMARIMTHYFDHQTPDSTYRHFDGETSRYKSMKFIARTTDAFILNPRKEVA